MNLRKTSAFAIVLLAALAYIFYVEVPKDQEKAVLEKLFGDLPRESISEIAIEHGDETFSLKNLGPSDTVDASLPGLRWQFGEVLGSSIDDAALNGLTAAIAELKPGSSLPSEDVEKDLAIYGLATPELSVVVKGVTARGKEIQRKLLFGKKNEYVRERYLQVFERKNEEFEASGVYLVPEALFLSASKPGSDFRRKSFISFVDSDVSALALTYAGGEVSVRRRSADSTASKSWLRKSPWILQGDTGGVTEVAASEEQIAQIFRDLRNARATAFIDGEEALAPETFGLDDQASSIAISFRDEKTPALRLKLRSLDEKDKHGRGPGDYIQVVGSPSLIFMDQGLSSKVFRSPEMLRDKAIFNITTADVQGLEIRRLDGEAVKLRRSDAGLWSVLGAEGDPSVAGEGTSDPVLADAAFVDELLGSLQQLQAVRFPTASGDFGLLNPKAEVMVTLKGASEGATDTVVLAVGDRVSAAADADFYVGVFDGKGAVIIDPVMVSAQSIEKVLPRRELLVPVPALGADPNAAQAAEQVGDTGDEGVPAGMTAE